MKMNNNNNENRKHHKEEKEYGTVQPLPNQRAVDEELQPAKELHPAHIVSIKWKSLLGLQAPNNC